MADNLQCELIQVLMTASRPDLTGNHRQEFFVRFKGPDDSQCRSQTETTNIMSFADAA
jgi:hypothetical protein